MMAMDDDSGAIDPCSDVLALLVAAFPQRVELDYFALCGLPRDAPIASENTRAAFDAVSSFLRVLDREGLGQGEGYAEAGVTYFWNFGLSLAGFDGAQTLQPEGSSTPPSCQEILRRLALAPSRRSEAVRAS